MAIQNSYDINMARISAATVTNVESSASSVQLIAANPERNGLAIVNTDANLLTIKYGATASATSCTATIAQNAAWTMPAPIYTGRIDGIWAADGSGHAVITEL